MDKEVGNHQGKVVISTLELTKQIKRADMVVMFGQMVAFMKAILKTIISNDDII